MQILVPMAGKGQRFVDAGFTELKPFIDLGGGETILDRVLKPFLKRSYVDGEDLGFKNYLIFVVSSDIDEKYIRQLESKYVDCNIVKCPPHNKGPVYTCSYAFDILDRNAPIFVCYCDNAFSLDFEKFQDYIENSKVDGCILTHVGFHPHSLNTTKMAFCKADPERKDNSILQIKEKECYTINHFEEPASTGGYYFRKTSLFIEYCMESMSIMLSYNNEFYVTLIYNLFIRDGYYVTYYNTDYVLVLGTPQELKAYLAWKDILSSGQVKDKNFANLIGCYLYWGEYENNLR